MFASKYCFLVLITLHYFKVEGRSFRKVRGTSKLTYPGTKWCGPGDNAKHYYDLGEYTETDKCCRDHDHCDDYIASHSRKYNLYNDASHARIYCSCDNQFHSCLKNVDWWSSYFVGILYFNLIDTKCYRESSPFVCVRFKGFFTRTCAEYRYDPNQLDTYEWTDVKHFDYF